MQELIDFAKNSGGAKIISLEVRSDNRRAVALYEKFGFETIG
ncbi:MAG TPA: GNAT family N-acetyltransferase, partial [Clostridiales bacterium]|nr:GNAT family N-acetyltransferase [Clostridiales bacterium]